MPRSPIVVIGAGAAGLSAAAALSAAGRTVILLEARDRIGGRIFTLEDPRYAMPVELGAEFIHGRPQTTWELVRRAQLTAYDIPFQHHHRHAGRLQPITDFSAALDTVMRGLSRIKHDTTFAEYLRSHPKLNRNAEAVRLALDFVEGFDAADPERISAKSLAREQESLGNVGEETQFRLLQGYGPLMDYLWSSCDRRKATLHLSTTVQEIRHDSSTIEVQCAPNRGGKEIVFRASQVIVTVPLGVLQLAPDARGGLRFSPDLPDKRLAMAKLASGPIVKAVMKFREPFWEDAAMQRRAGADESLRDASFFHDTRAPFPTIWTPRPLRLPVLTAWAGGPRAVALSRLSQAAQIDAAVHSLAMLFKARPATMQRMLERVHIADWSKDPYSRGAYSYEMIGGAAARRVLAQPVGKRLFFAGEATDTNGEASTVAGAIASGQRAAKEALQLARTRRS